MNRQDIDILITQLMAIENYAKDIHYNCSGTDFYGKHLFADRCAENMSDYIDQLKEVCLLGCGIKPLPSILYLRRASDLVPSGASFKMLREIMIDTLVNIDNLKELKKGDNLLGTIAQDIQNNVGLLNIMFREVEE